MSEPSWWWIDYMEGELSEGLKADLTDLLTLSEEDRQELDRLRTLRSVIRQSEPHLMVSKRQTKRLHDRIMKAVEDCDSQPASTKKPSGERVDLGRETRLK